MADFEGLLDAGIVSQMYKLYGGPDAFDTFFALNEKLVVPYPFEGRATSNLLSFILVMKFVR